MLKKIARRMLRIARGTTLVVGATVVLAMMLGVATTALAGTGVGATFNLGKTNSVNAVNKLVGSITGSMLVVDNNGSGTALDLQVGPSTTAPADKTVAPMKVDSQAVVSNLNADELDGKSATDFAQAYGRTIVVGPVGTPNENGTALRSALAGITGASASNGYVLKVEPGVYDLGTGTLNMKPYVDIEGSGEQVTRITAAGTPGSDANTLTGASNAELRFLTVENTGGGDYATAIRNDFAAPGITHVTARASGGTLGSRGIVNSSASPRLAQVTVQATGAGSKKTGIQNYTSTVTIKDTDISLSGAGGEKRAIENTDGVGGHDTVTLADVNISVSEGSGDHYGITTFDYDVRATDVRINVSGGGSNYGVHTRDGVGGFDLLTLQGMKIFASGGANNTGIYNSDVDSEISGSRIEAEGGTSIGVRAAEPGVGKYDEVRIDDSVVRGATNTVQATGGANVRIGASRLHGGPSSSVNACAGVYDENYVFSASTCP